MIDPATVQKIKDTADIVEVVGDYVHLVRSGANFKGLCPFHNERTPSFSVNRSRNFCYCFSCHKGGSPVNFIMEKEGLSYHDALLHLARRYGIKVEEREITDEERARQSKREEMRVANEWAMKEMERNLLETEDGRSIGLQYFYVRGVTEEAVRAFHLGYALDRPAAMLDAARKAGIDIPTLIELGIIGKSERDGSLYDRFRGRVIFPVFNPAGMVVAFGGRDLMGKSKAKYVNSPESTFYSKSNELYGIHQAKSAISRLDKCFLVEGYMDVIGMWQSGMENVVASSGTALTDGQIAMIHRFTENITLIYDGDAAGIKASLRGINMLLSHKMNVKVLLLPDGHDPDSFARANTPEQFRQYVADHETDIIRFKVQVLMKDVGNDPARRIEAVRSIVESLACISDKIARNVYIQECSQLMGMDEAVIASEVTRARAGVEAKLRSERDGRILREQDARMREQQQMQSGTQSAASTASTGTSSPASRTVRQETPLATVANTPAAGTVRQEIPTARGYTLVPNAPSPLEPLERRLCELTLRYGLVDLFPIEEEEKQKEETSSDSTADDKPADETLMLNVAEYIADELEADNINFTNPVYGKIFDIILYMRDELDASRADFMARVESQLQQQRKEGYDEIAARNLPMTEIHLQERMLEHRLQQCRDDAWQTHVKDYPGRVLASHEDEDVRHTVTDLLYEPWELSKIFFRDRAPEREEDRLSIIVPRAIIELKDEILNQELKRLMNCLRETQSTASPEELEKLQAEIFAKHRLRSMLSKNIGERILSSRNSRR